MTELERLTANICRASFGEFSGKGVSEDESALQHICQLCSEVSGEIKSRITKLIAKLVAEEPGLGDGKNSKLQKKYWEFLRRYERSVD
jgi:hypothetical protein